MSISCSFHPSLPAHFQCDNCDTSFCEACISSRDTKSYSGKSTYYFCPACETEATLTGVSNILEPFWKRLGPIFLYPLQKVPLVMTLGLSMLGALMPFNLLVQLLVWVVMMKYAYAVLIETGKGSLKAPVVSWKTINSDLGSVFKQVVIYVLTGWLSMVIFARFGPLAGVPFLALSALCMPMIIMLLVATDSMFRALNPMLFFPVILRIGWPYLLLYLFFTLLSSGPFYLLSLITMELPPQVSQFLSLFVGQFYLLVSYHLMGYVLLQYHKEIGYEVDYNYFLKNSAPESKRKPLSEKEKFNNTLEVLIKSGRYDKAIPLVREKIAVDSPDIALAEKYLQLLKLAGDTERASNYTPMLIGHLVNGSRKKQAMELFEEILANKSPSPDPEATLIIGDWFEEIGKNKLAMNSYLYSINTADKNNTVTPRAYYRLAVLLNEKGNNSGKAVKLLHGIIKSYPDSDTARQARTYLQAMG